MQRDSHKRLATRWLHWLLVLFSPSVHAAGLQPLQTFVPAEETNLVLHNPDMGWVIYENYPIDSVRGGSSTLVNLPEEKFPEVDAAALMFSWQDIEKSEGQYDFSKVDFAYDYWRALGKAIQLRLSTTSLVWWSNRKPPAGTGVPDHILDKIPGSQKATRAMEGIPYVVEDARNPFYQERLRAFLKAVAAHFGPARPVTLIDLRGFGVWGEWHTGFKYDSIPDRRIALKNILDIWTESFPSNFLALSYSYDPDGPKELYAGSTKQYEPEATSRYQAFLEYSAFDYALTKSSICFRRDGCGGAVHSNERLLNSNAFKLERGPFMSEFLGGYSAVKKAGTNWVNWMIEDALSLHPNYINLLGWQSGDSLRFTRERPDLVSRGALRMGYRLTPLKFTFPKIVTARDPFQVQMEWVNRGVGRAMQDFEIRFEIRNTPVSATSEPIVVPSRHWVAGENYRLSETVRFPGLKAGSGRLCFYLQEHSGRKISLPLRGRLEDGAYDLGAIEVR